MAEEESNPGKKFKKEDLHAQWLAHMKAQQAKNASIVINDREVTAVCAKAEKIKQSVAWKEGRLGMCIPEI